jgi:CTP synthase
VPFLDGPGEHKSKPTQHSVKGLRSMGIAPDIIIARADEPLSSGIKEKISLFCNVKPDCVIENTTVSSLYEAPLMLCQNGLDDIVCRELNLDAPKPDLSEWKMMAQKIAARKKTASIAIVGKYVDLHDAYLSIIECLNHAGFETEANVNIRWVDSEDVTEQSASAILGGIDGMIVPGGFGDRGIEGKIAACRYARENDIPYLGICLGMQIAAIEFARNVCGLEGAHSGEFSEASPHRVIDIMPSQVGMIGSGGTMRLGAWPCKISKGSVLHRLYGSEEISERHRHRFEFNNDYREIFTSKGMSICGLSPDGGLVEAVELPCNRFFVGVQFHPEFKGRPNRPHPLFLGLLQAALKQGATHE